MDPLPNVVTSTATQSVVILGGGLAGLTAAYRLALGRPPRTGEAQQALLSMQSRGLVSVCWALLNSTEFVYVR